MGDALLETPLIIRFDGLDAAQHEIEIQTFAKSIKGFGRIIAVTANFAATEQFIQHKDAMDVRVVVRPPEPNCVTMAAVIQWVEGSPLLTNVVGGLLVLLIGYVFARNANQKQEMKHLHGALETAIRELGNRISALLIGSSQRSIKWRIRSSPRRVRLLIPLVGRFRR